MISTDFVVGALFVIFWIAVLSVAARRLLELHAGPLRLLVSGAAGLTVAVLALGERMQTNAERPVFIFLFVGIGVLSAMGLLILGELIAPPGARPRPVRWYRSARGWWQRTRRYSQVTRIAVRHGLGAYLSGRRSPTASGGVGLARRLRLALEEGGVVFVKFGQILSTRHDLLSPEFSSELGRLQNRVAPVEWPHIESLLEEELGTPVHEVFAQFDTEPIAAGSIAQVHRARLRAGQAVVVKVQRPGIRPIVEGDLDITQRIARLLHRRAAWARSIGVVELAHGFAEGLREELDFTIEARNMAGVIAARTYDDVVISRVHAGLSTRRILVMDFLDGVALDEATPIIDEHGMDRTELARRLLHTLLTQIMLDGIFLADPHPGNLMLLRDGRLGLLDFGLVGRLDARLRTVLQRLLLAVDAGDATALSDALVDVVERPEDIDEAGLERAVGRFMARHLGPGLQADVEMFTDMFRMVSQHGVSVPAELAAVFRALATVEGTLAQLAPGFNIVDESRAFAHAYLHEAMLPKSLRSTATAEAAKLLPLIQRLPRRLERITSALEHGTLLAGVRLFADDRDRRIITRLVHQTLLTILAASTGIIGAILLGLTGGPQVAANLSLHALIAYSLLILSGTLILRLLTSIFRGG